MEKHIQPCEENINRLDYNIIDCMSPGDADEWAEDIFHFDYDSDRELKQKLKLKVTEHRQKHGSQFQTDTRSKMTYKNILNEEREKRKRLIRNLKEFEKSVEDLRKMAHSERNQTIARIMQQTQKFEEVKNEFMKDFLQVTPNPIFITGETSSGKSSFINLLLRDNIMPVDFDRCSSTFCIISKNDEKLATVHFKDKGKKSLRISDQDSDEFNKKCKHYLAGKKEDVAYVELKCPSEILKDDVVIMDSPGMGDPDFIEGLKEKIRDSCAFVYVLKHYNPIAEDCWELADLIKENARSGWREASALDNDTMVFIVNKWDTVQKNKSETYESIYDRLKDFLGNVSRNRVITMSVRDATFMQKHGVVAEDYKSFLELLNSLQISAITNRTRKFHTLVVDYMSSIVETLEFLGQVLNTDMKARQEKADILDKGRVDIAMRLDEYYHKKKEECKQIVQRRTENLRSIMKQDKDFRENFLKLMCHTIPYAVSQADMDQQIAKLAADKLSHVLEAQEQKDRFLNRIRTELINDFFKKFCEFEVKMKQSQERLFCGRKVDVIGKDKTLMERALPHWSQLSLKKKIMVSLAMPVYAPFIAGVFLVSINKQILLRIYKMFPNQARLVTMEDRREYVAKRSQDIYQRYIEKESILTDYVNEIMKDVFETLDHLYELSKKQLENLRDDARVLRQENDEDRNIMMSSKVLQEKLGQYLLTLYRFEFECLQYDRVLHESLFIYDNPSRPLSRSTNTAIYGVTVTEGAMADMKEMGADTNRAALKRVYWKVMADDVNALHTEIQLCIHRSKNSNLLRMIRVVKSPPNCEVINVSLLCEAVKMSLRSYIFERTPNMDGQEKFSYLFECFTKIQRSLDYLHNCEEKVADKETYLTGYELNLDTIMVTMEEKIKLINLKLPGSLNFSMVSTQDGAHSYRHIPPPVILCDRIYDAAADLYSMAIAQFEAWFHAEAFLEFTFDPAMPKDSLYTFAHALKDPVKVLSTGPYINVAESDQYSQQWLGGVCDIIKDYMENDANLTAAKWASYFPQS